MGASVRSLSLACGAGKPEVQLSLSKSVLSAASFPHCSVPQCLTDGRKGEKSSQSEDRNALYKNSHPPLPPKLP